MLRKQKAASNVQARLLCAEVYRDANPVCRCFRQPTEYTAGWGLRANQRAHPAENAILTLRWPQPRHDGPSNKSSVNSNGHFEMADGHFCFRSLYGRLCCSG